MIQNQLQLFSERLPAKPYCTDDLSAGLLIRTKSGAIRRKYIQANPPWLRCWMIHDIDHANAALAWDDAGLPPPSWTTVNPMNGHAHCAWGLDAPVLVGDCARQAPLRYLVAIESAFRAALGGDPAYSGLITKNPANAAWKTLYGPVATYDMGFLADHVDLSKHKPKLARVGQVGLGRNCTVFDVVRLEAYREVLGWKRAKSAQAFVLWQKHLYDRCLTINGDFPVPMISKECYHIARSIARFTWREFTDEKRSAWAAAKGRAGGKAKGKANEDKRASAALMRAQGMSQVAIADALGVTERTVRNWTGK